VLRLGVDLGGTKIEAAVLASDGAVAVRRRTPTPSAYDAKLEAIRTLVEAVESDAAVGAPLPLGIGHPGSVNPRTGLMRNANSTALNGRPLLADLERVLKRPVRGANDANCFALSEATDGAGAGAASVFGVIAGTGVGGGLVLDGRLIRRRRRQCGGMGPHRPALAERRTSCPVRTAIAV
jgi:fructokinase